MEKNRRLLILCPYPKGSAGSQRFRFEQYIPFLEVNNIVVDQQSFLTTWGWGVVYKKGYHLFKIWATLLGFLRRFFCLFFLWRYDLVMVHREASPIGPPIIEWWIAHIAKKRLIYDFDDAIWIKNTSNSWISWLKNPEKTNRICTWSSMVCVGNQHLADFATQHNDNVVIIPTTIDTEHHHNTIKKHVKNKAGEVVCIGWTGSHSTLPYLKNIEGALKAIQQRHNICFKIIADKTPQELTIPFDFEEWNIVHEIDQLQDIDIGIMPLPNEEWAKGKCAFKALQYLSLGIPCVASPVGANKNVVLHGQTGFLAESKNDWIEALERLLFDHALRSRLGEAGREHVMQYFSVISQQNTYVRKIKTLML